MYIQRYTATRVLGIFGVAIHYLPLRAKKTAYTPTLEQTTSICQFLYSSSLHVSLYDDRARCMAGDKKFDVPVVAYESKLRSWTKLKRLSQPSLFASSLSRGGVR